MSEKVSKRHFLGYVVAAILALIGTVVTAVVGSAAIIPVFGRRNREWVELTAESGLGDQPKPFSMVQKLQQGWHSEERIHVVYAYKGPDSNPIVYSSVCTHLGCGVRWDRSSEQFRCPCHGGAFDRSGNAVSGPPAESLRPLQVRVEDGKILVRPA